MLETTLALGDLVANGTMPARVADVLRATVRARRADIAKLSLVVYLRSFGDWRAPTRRIVETVHAVEATPRGPRAVEVYRA